VGIPLIGNNDRLRHFRKTQPALLAELLPLG